MTNTVDDKSAANWAEWLGEMLDSRGWRQADLVSASQGHIKRDRASKWLSGKEAPSFRLAIVVANTLGVSRESALRAAGFTGALDVSTPAESKDVRGSLEDYTEEELLEELLRRRSNVGAALEDGDLPRIGKAREKQLRGLPRAANNGKNEADTPSAE